MCTPTRRLLSRTLKLASSAGAIAAVLALAGTALTQEAPSKDEKFAASSLVSGFCTGNPPVCQNIVSFDISFVDPAIHIYVLGDRTNKAVDVINTNNNSLVAQFKGSPDFTGAVAAANCASPGGGNDCSGPDGVLIVKSTEVWAGNGDSSVRVFNMSGTQIHNISTHGQFRADEMCYDSADDLVMVANNADNPPFASIIPRSGPLAYTAPTQFQIKFNGTNNAPNSNNGAEQCQWSPKTGKFYISIPGIVGGINGGGGVAVIDPKTKMVEKTFLIDGNDCIAPQGMALGPSNQILLGCNGDSGNGKFSTVIINQNTGATIAVLDNESGSDEVWFNPGDGHYFLARSAAGGAAAGGFQQLGVVDAIGHRKDESFATAISGTINAHSVAADSASNQVYVPIPGANAANPQGASTLCASLGGSNTQGCIAVFTTTNDDRSRFAHERDPDDKQE
jgi:hypothetical protein